MGKIGQVFSVTFFMFNASWGREGGRGTYVIREALNMEHTQALITGLLVFSATINQGVTKGTLDIHRGWVCTILVGEGL